MSCLVSTGGDQRFDREQAPSPRVGNLPKHWREPRNGSRFEDSTVIHRGTGRTPYPWIPGLPPGATLDAAAQL